MNSLASTIREAIRERDLSYRAIAARAEEQGYVLSFSTVSTYATGKTRTYSRQKLEAIAVGLGMNKNTFMQEAGVPLLGDPFELPADAALLEPHERDAVRSVVSAFIQNHTRDRKAVGNHADSSSSIAEGDELAQRRRDLTQHEIDTLPHVARPPVKGIEPEEDPIT